MKLYIAGPMKGMPGLNFAAFDEAARVLRAMGHQVSSPAEMDRTNGIDPNAGDGPDGYPQGVGPETMRADLRIVLDSDGIVMLPGWERSVGATLERLVAESTGRAVYELVEVWAKEPDNFQLRPAPRWDHPAIWEAGRRNRAARRESPR